jgi:hypothetical protein
MSRIRRIRYSGDQWVRIAEALALPRPTQYLKRALPKAAEEYRWAKTTEEKYSLGRAEQRRRLKEIKVKTAELYAALRKLDYPTTELLETPITVDDVALLVAAAEQAIDRVHRTGGEPKKARLQYVRELARIFEIATGRRPARRVHDREYGPFRDFVEASLRPIDPHAISGFDFDIRKAIKPHSVARRSKNKSRMEVLRLLSARMIFHTKAILREEL